MISNGLINTIACFHKNTTDFLTGVNPPYHRHEDTYEIYLYIKGNSKIYVEQQCFIPSPGSLVLIRPNELHRSIILDNSPYERIGININEACFDVLSTDKSSLLTCFSPNKRNSCIKQLTPAKLREFINLTDDFLRYQQSNLWGNDLLAITSITKLLVLVNQSFHISCNKEYENIMPEIVVNTMRYIENNLTNEITLTKMSNNLNYSGNYLSKQFKTHTGLTIREYIFDKKIELAKNALRDGMNVSDACVAAGFNDYANFIRSFTKKTGISPGRFISKHD